MLAEAASFNETHSAGELRIVAQFSVCIQWQVVGEQTDVMCHQHSNTAAFHIDQTRIFATPEIPMMYQDRICTEGYCGLQESKRSSYTTDQFAHFTPAFHLESIWAIITKVGDIQKLVQIGFELIQSHLYLPVSIAIIFTSNSIDLKCTNSG